MSHRHPAFPRVPASQRVGSINGRRFMESYSDNTLRNMATGHAGEPPAVIRLAESILRLREIEKEAATA